MIHGYYGILFRLLFIYFFLLAYWLAYKLTLRLLPVFVFQMFLDYIWFNFSNIYHKQLAGQLATPWVCIVFGLITDTKQSVIYFYLLINLNQFFFLYL